MSEQAAAGDPIQQTAEKIVMLYGSAACADRMRCGGVRPLCSECRDLVDAITTALKAVAPPPAPREEKTALKAKDAEIKSLREALRGLRNKECWCDVGVGSPMMSSQHTLTCTAISLLMKEDEIDAVLGKQEQAK